MASLPRFALGLALGLGALNASAAILLPELIYYKFNEAVGSTTTTNSASSPVGTLAPTLTGLQIVAGGASGNTLGGASGTAARYIDTGWSAAPLNTPDWTLAFWTGPAANTALLSFFFGDESLLRGFTEGNAGPDGFIVRGGGLNDTLISGMSSTTNNHIAFVRDSTASAIRGYLNGSLAVTVAQPGNLNFASTNFFVGGRGTVVPSNGLQAGVWMDEFQLYSRALDGAGVVDAMNANFVTAAVPEPASLVLVGLALAGVVASRRQPRRASASA